MPQVKEINVNFATSAGQFNEGSLEFARRGSGETTGHNIDAGPPISGQKLFGSKDPGGVSVAFSNNRHFMSFDIPSTINRITNATLTLHSLIYLPTGSGTERKFLQKGKLVSASIAGSSVAAGDYDSVNTGSMVAYDDTSGITISGTSGSTVTTTLNTAALTELNRVIGSNFEIGLMEFEHDFNNSGSFTSSPQIGLAQYGFSLNPTDTILTLTGHGGGLVKITSGKVTLPSGKTKLEENQI